MLTFLQNSHARIALPAACALLLLVGLAYRPVLADTVNSSASTPDAARLLESLHKLEKDAADGVLPQTRDAPALLARRLVDVGEFGAANRACLILGRVAPVQGKDALVCARPLLARGDVRAAQKMTEAFLRHPVPADGPPITRYVEAAAVFEQWARYAEAADYLTRGLKAAPGDVDVSIRAVHDLLRAGMIDKALLITRLLNGKVVNHKRVFLRKVCLLMVEFGVGAQSKSLAMELSGLPGFGEADLDAVLSVARSSDDPKLAEKAVGALMKAAPSRRKALETAASLLERHDLLDVAIDLMKKGIREHDLDRPRDLFVLGRLLVLAGKRKDASRTFDSYLSRLKEGVTKEAIRVSSVWMNAQMPRMAVRTLKRFGDKRDMEWSLAMGDALQASGDDVAEWEVYEKAARVVSRPASFWLRIGNRLLSRHDTDHAAEAFRRIIDSAPENGDIDRMTIAKAHIGLAEALVRMNDITDKDVEMELMAALKAAEGDQAILKRIEKVAGHIAPSGALNVALMEAAVRASPERSDLWIGLADASLKADMWSKAVESYINGIRSSNDIAGALEHATKSL
ncbi:MAG: hypothetical protein GXP54_08180, partial [Deltaproteobacteria bacterium]|nr:hypothetical protein [Deltaproteobacteria bacterium]